MLFCNSTPKLKDVHSIRAVLSQENMFYTVGSMDSVNCLSVGSMLLSVLRNEDEGFANSLIFN